MEYTSLGNMPWWKSGVAGEATAPFRNFVMNWNFNPGHEDGTPIVGLGEIGGQGKRDQFIGALSTATFPLTAASGAAGTIFRTISAVGSIESQREGWDKTLDLVKTAYGVGNQEAIQSSIEQLQPQTNSVASFLSGAWHEFGTADQSKMSGKIGTLADVSGGLSGIAKTIAIEKIAGEDPLLMSKLLPNVAKNMIETGIGILGRYADKIPLLRNVNVPASLDSVFGFSGGAIQNYLSNESTISPEVRQQALAKAQSLLETGMLE